MLDVISLGDYYAAIIEQVGNEQLGDEQAGLPELSSAVNTICGQRFRRIDRFIQLCLLGSARCGLKHHIEAQTGLYIGSRFAAIRNTIAVQEQMFLKGQLPKPASFINTLSNSAGYYVARNLQLTGKNLFVSRADASLEAALQLASLDLLSGQVQQALVGVVDEGVLPQAQHCFRMGVPKNTPLGEGSHWFLLRRASASANTSKLARINEVCLLSDRQSLHRWLDAKQAQHSNIRLHCSAEIAAQVSDLELPLYQPQQALNCYPARTAGVLLRFIQAQQAGALITLQGDADGRFHATHTVI